MKALALELDGKGGLSKKKSRLGQEKINFVSLIGYLDSKTSFLFIRLFT